MLEVLAGLVAGLLIVAGILVMLGPNTRSLVRRIGVLQPAKPREVVATGLNPKTQRVLVAASRLGSWLRAHSHEEVARELRSAAGRMTSDEPSGLYAMQTVLRRLRTLSLDDRGAQERLRTLSNELREAVQDRFEQLELLPFRRP
ncbi:MAG: hypothetical protein E6J40_07820 [Chloroflexi bacterium]|nr:MAG: hypothetical protein E6J40_07820 [Chloroflexota bacterium]